MLCVLRTSSVWSDNSATILRAGYWSGGCNIGCPTWLIKNIVAHYNYQQDSRPMVAMRINLPLAVSFLYTNNYKTYRFFAQTTTNFEVDIWNESPLALADWIEPVYIYIYIHPYQCIHLFINLNIIPTYLNTSYRYLTMFSRGLSLISTRTLSLTSR